jgi:outer membrane murein-binding lipoprotein Lpp
LTFDECINIDPRKNTNFQDLTPKVANLEIILEDIRGKFELVLEGHASLRQEIRNTREELSEKIDLVDFKVETLNRKIDDVDARLSGKIDAVAADLKAHRSDTEAHPKLYRVQEN